MDRADWVNLLDNIVAQVHRVWYSYTMTSVDGIDNMLGEEFGQIWGKKVGWMGGGVWGNVGEGVGEMWEVRWLSLE